MTTTPLTLTADVLENQLLALVAISVRSHQVMQGLARSAAAYSAQHERDDADDEQIAEVLGEMIAEFKILTAARKASAAIMQALGALDVNISTAEQAFEDITELEALADGFVEDALLLPGLFMFTRVTEAWQQAFGEYLKTSWRKAQRLRQADDHRRNY